MKTRYLSHVYEERYSLTSNERSATQARKTNIIGHFVFLVVTISSPRLCKLSEVAFQVGIL